jgi:CHAT domain-containing protein/tetratricopeptide (TPR) repeat protein
MLKPLIAGFCGFLFIAGGSRPEAVIQAAQAPSKCESILAAAENRAKSEDVNAWKDAINLYQQVLDCTPLTENHQRVKILAKLSRMQLLVGENDKAIVNLQSALQILQQFNDEEPDAAITKAKLLGNLALGLKSVGRMDEALVYYGEARSLFENSRDLKNQATTWMSIGLVEFLRGETQAALDDYTKGLKLCDTDSTNLELQKNRAGILDLRGRVYAQMNDSTRAMRDFKDALALARKTQEHRFLGQTLNDIGVLQLKQNRPSTAESNHQHALKEFKEIVGDPNGTAESQALLADVQVYQSRYEEARKNYHEALGIQEQTGDVIGQAQTHFSMGMLESRTRNWPAAQESFARAVELYQPEHHRVGESNARFHIAKVLDAQGNKKAARQEVEQAIQLAEEVRNFTAGGDLRTLYFASIDQMYRFHIDLLLNAQGLVSNADQLRAFDLFQHAQSRTLLDKLRSRVGTEVLRAGNPEAARTREDQERKLAGLLNAQPNATNPKKIFESIQKLESLLKESDAQVLAGNPRMAIFSPILLTKDIQSRVLDSESSLVQFYLSNPHSYAWVVTKSSITLIRLPSRKILERDIRRVLQFGMAGDWTASQDAALKNLRGNLAPILAATSEKRWIVVPDGGLHHFPFMLLASVPVNGTGPKEIGPREIVKVPSASAVDIIRHTNNAPHPAYALAVFADPVFDNLDSAVNRSRTTRSSPAKNSFLPRLPHTSKEAQTISGFFPPGQSRIWRRLAATKDAAAGAALQGFRNIHLATHSMADEEDPEQSRIVLTRVYKNGKPRPGDIFIKDIYQMKLSADLVVLSSCQSALGKQQAGEGPISLSRAFLFAGAKAVVASLWEVNSEATGELMQRFYHYRQNQKMPPSTALAMAQADFRNHPDKRFRNPFYWAGFEFYGEWMVQ